MTAVISQAQEELNAQIAEVRGHITRLQGKLRAADAELAELAGERERHQLLRDICQALDKLEAQGASDLFWGEGGAPTNAAHLERVRARVAGFAEKLAAIEQRRNAVQEEIEKHLMRFDLLSDELMEQQEREEAAKYEFVVDREFVAPPYTPAVMPWSEEDEDRKRFRKTLLLSLLVALLLGTGFGIWKLPLRDRAEPAEIPERLVELVQREKPKPPEPKPVEQKKPEKKDEEKPSEKPTQPEPQKTRAKAEQSGILAFKNTFADLMKDDATEKLDARVTTSGQKAAGDTRRNLVVANAREGSRGINTAAISRNVGGAGKQVGGVAFSRVESSVGDLQEANRPLSDGVGPSRTDEEIQIVFDRYKAALYRIYNRELRIDPTLRGKMVLRLTIEPGGEVSACAIESTDLASAALKTEVVDRVKRFNFGAKEGVPRITILYPIDFLPAR